MRSSREKSELYQTMSWRGSPERWVTRSRTTICSVRTGSYILKAGKRERMGTSQPPLPSSKSMPRSVTVNDFVMLAMAQRDFGVMKLFFDVAITIAFEEDHFVALDYGDGGSCTVPVLDGLIDEVVEAFESFGRVDRFLLCRSESGEQQ